jgi:DNA gyrase subunit A
MFVASTHEYILLFTDRGRCYWLKVFEIPEGGRTARGKSIGALVSKEPGETIMAYVTVKSFDAPLNVLMVTDQGNIKKTALSEFSNPRKTGIGAIGLSKGDSLIDVHLTDAKRDIIIGTSEGKAIRFAEQEVRTMGRAASGVRAIRLNKGDRVVGGVVLRRSDMTILIATELGFGKRSNTEEYRISHRGGKGIITVKTTEKTGRMIAIKEVTEKDDVVIVTTHGVIIRQHASAIRIAGRNTQGVHLIRLDQGDQVADVAAVPPDEDEPSNGNGQKAPENGTAKDAPATPPQNADQISLFKEQKGKAARPRGQKKTAAKGKAKKR